MMISALIPVHNEDKTQLAVVINNLTAEFDFDELEIIIVNDGSCNPDGTFNPITYWDFPWTNVQIINNTRQQGVGYSFDRAAEVAHGETLVIMGADTFAMPLWAKTLWTLQDNEIGCGCNVGLQPGNHDITREGLYRRYGAKILYTLTVDDLPKHSELRKDPDYRDIIESKWLPKQGDEPYEIPCVYGAFYFMKREFYDRIGGWDTQEGVPYRGHKMWGALEAHLSLKARVYGGKCMMYPALEVGHIFGRIDDIFAVRAIREDCKYWNKLFIAHTLLDDELRDEVISFMPPSRNWNLAQMWVRKNWDTIAEVRQKNISQGKLISR